ncbi:MAG: methylmalonyl-CoA epimerase [Firmicutes bacterium]|nr:methylmalonyl-CoA epimerase [Bacillota bacterium]
MFQRIDHLGIATRNLEESLKLYVGIFGLKLQEIELIESQGVRVAIIPVGESRIELLEPTGPDSPLARSIEARGEGLHHVAYAVEDVAACLEQARRGGLKLIDEQPRPGAGGSLIAFIHPRSTGDVLTELCQHRGPVHG